MTTKAELQSILIFTDGACTGNPGPGGWAAILASPTGQVQEIGGGEPETTNNRMELSATIQALKMVRSEIPILLYTDSTYVIRGITQWIWGWRSRGWKNAEGQEISNRDLWEKLSREVQRLKTNGIEWRYVRGHTGVPGNERCDEIAVGFAKGKWVDLFKGSLLKYSVALHDLPESHELPPMRQKEAKAPAYSYLSYYGGKVVRHSTWAECERRVKGQSQAKFKKAKSQADEADILRSWGLNPESTVIFE